MLLGRTVFSAVAAVGLIAGTASAEELRPVQGKTIDLGTIGGIVYYTVQPEGYRVVATLGTETPVRFIATLAPEQVISLSAPRGLGEPAREVRITRHGEQLLIDGGADSASGLENDDIAQAPIVGSHRKLD